MNRAILLIVLVAAMASATPIGLFNWALNLDGSLYEPSSGDAPEDLPAFVDHSGFDWNSGLGSININITNSGSHSIFALFDHEINEAINTYYNEYGTVSNPDAKPNDLSWEIDEPGYLFGDIYDNFRAGRLKNENNIDKANAEDVSMAMGWKFNLPGPQPAVVSFNLDSRAPDNFFLSHLDKKDPEIITMSSNLDINGSNGSEVIPEPATLLLTGLGLIFAGFYLRKKRI